MKNKVITVLITCILLTLFSYTVGAVVKEKQTAALQFEMQPGDTAGGLRITESVTNVKLGSIGFITIQGQPGVRYTVTSSFKTGDEMRSVSQWRIADESGRATFLWSVSPETTPGTYPITISGGGSTLRLSHNVLP